MGELQCFTDELVLGRTRLDSNRRLCIDSISSEDHRKLPSAVMESVTFTGTAVVGCVGDVLYTVDTSDGSVYASELSVTVRSDAYRIQRSGSGARNSGQRCLQVDQTARNAASEPWLRVFFHVFEKFPARSLNDGAINPQSSCLLDLGVVVPQDQNN